MQWSWFDRFILQSEEIPSNEKSNDNINLILKIFLGHGGHHGGYGGGGYGQSSDVYDVDDDNDHDLHLMNDVCYDCVTGCVYEADDTQTDCDEIWAKLIDLAKWWKC